MYLLQSEYILDLLKLIKDLFMKWEGRQIKFHVWSFWKSTPHPMGYMN